MKYILRFFVLLIAMALDTTAMPALEFMGGFPLLSFTIVLALAMHGGAMETVITAAAVGAVTDLLYQSVFGLNLLLYMYIGLIVWVVHQFIYTKNIAMACLYTFIATVVFQGFYALFGFVIFGQSVPFFVCTIVRSAENALLMVFFYPLIGRLAAFFRKKEAV